MVKRALATRMNLEMTSALSLTSWTFKISVVTQLIILLQLFVNFVIFGASVSLFPLFHAWWKNSEGLIAVNNFSSISVICRANSTWSTSFNEVTFDDLGAIGAGASSNVSAFGFLKAYKSHVNAKSTTKKGSSRHTFNFFSKSFLSSFAALSLSFAMVLSQSVLNCFTRFSSAWRS